jgi:hypothetical protein
MSNATTSRRLFVATYLAPVAVLLVVAIWPLVSGGRTLVVRDILNIHYEMKWAQAEAMSEGRIPLVDPWRSGGQAHLGNPNTTALYPDNALLAVASPLWVLNARFWLHWLLAPLAFAWLARAWGLGREPAFAGGVCYAACGFFLSNLNLHNLVAGVTLAPALAAAALGVAAGRRPGWHWGAAGLAWALLLLAGDPMTAGIALVVALASVVTRHGLRAPHLGRLGLALALGSLVAAPQIVEFLRILPATFRGHWGFSSAVASSASLHPATAIEWVLPLFFGAPDLAFWGSRFYTGGSPLYYSLFPGGLALALVAMAGCERKRAAVWSWTAMAVGIFLALGGHNPAARWLLALGGGLARLPVKFWLPVAMGGSLLCALGFERFLAGRGRAALARALAVLGCVYGIWLAVSVSRSGSALVEALLPVEASPGMVEVERMRWVGLAASSLALTLGLAVLAWGARRRPALAGLLLALHLAGQLLLLQPLLATDEAAFYSRPPAALAAVPVGARVVQGEESALFGRDPVKPADYPDSRLAGLERRLYQTLGRFALARWARRAELAPSPEGLDAFVSRAATQAVARLDDAGRLRLLAASGVEYLALSRPLELAGMATPSEALVERVWHDDVAGAPLSIYRLRSTAPAIRFVGTVHRAAFLNEALVGLIDPEFDPATETILAGEGADIVSAGGRLVRAEEAAERLSVRVEAAGPGALVWQRAPLPIYRALVDGRPVPVQVADLHRLAVEVAAGDHEVEIWVDRRPFRVASLVGLVALAALAGGCWRLERAGSQRAIRPAAR